LHAIFTLEKLSNIMKIKEKDSWQVFYASIDSIIRETNIEKRNLTTSHINGDDILLRFRSMSQTLFFIPLFRYVL